MRLLPLAILAAAIFASLEAPAQPWRARPAPRRVIVTNFPDPQNVSGAVEVTNLPAVQDVRVVNAPPPSTSARFQLVGFTSATFTGGQGVLGFTRACQQEFPGSRMCSSTEVMETTTVPSGLSGEAWVRPTLISSGDIRVSLPDSGGAADAAGISGSPETLSCDGWRNDLFPVGGTGGLVIDAAGRFYVAGRPGTMNCAGPRAVACCAPVP